MSTEHPFTKTERQDRTYSGNNLRTVVVRIPVKKDPLWTDRKCERKRRKLSLSAGIVMDSLCNIMKYSINSRTTSSRWHANCLVLNFCCGKYPYNPLHKSNTISATARDCSLIVSVKGRCLTTELQVYCYSRNFHTYKQYKQHLSTSSIHKNYRKKLFFYLALKNWNPL